MKISTARLKQIIKEELFYREFHRETEEIAEGFDDVFLNPFGDPKAKRKKAEREEARREQSRATAGADFDAEQKRIRDSGQWWLAGDPVRIYVPNTVDPNDIKKWLDDNASDYIIGGAFNEGFYVYEPHPVDVIKQVYRWDPAEPGTMVELPRKTK